MGFLPGLKASDWDEDSKNAWQILILAYFSTLMYSILLFLALFNTYYFLIKQQRWKKYSLFLFYFFSICCCISRISYSVLVVPANQQWWITVNITPCVFKAFIAFSLMMTMIELRIRVDQSMLIYKLDCPELMTDDQTVEFYRRQRRMDKQVVLIEWFFTILILAISTVLTVSDRIESQGDKIPCDRFTYLYDFSSVVGVVFIVLFILYSISIFRLLLVLNRKFKKVNFTGSSVFREQLYVLFTYLTLFGLSFIARFLLDTIFQDLYLVSPCPEVQDVTALGKMITYNLIKGYLFDYIPIATVLYLHFKNFKTKEEKDDQFQSHIQSPIQERCFLDAKSSSASRISRQPTYVTVEDFIRGSVKNQMDISYRSRQSTRKFTNISRKGSHIGLKTDTAKTCIGNTNLNRDTEVDVDEIDDLDMPTQVQQNLRMTDLSLLNQTIEVQQFSLGLLRAKKFFQRKKSIHHNKFKPGKEPKRKSTYDEIASSRETRAQFFE